MEEAIKDGVRQEINGELKVYYDGYWIKYYEAPIDSLTAKKNLIHSLTRRLFNHMEHGINIPGKMLDKVRSAYEEEPILEKKRVKGAMLAGALFNRAADIFSHLVELEACGIEIKRDNDLMRTCGSCLQEALELGKLVKHRNGDEGIDELWGEPFKAFIMTVGDFYETRYVKIAMTMTNIEQVADYMIKSIYEHPCFDELSSLILQYADVAKRKCEILRTDDDILGVWADFVVAGEKITGYQLENTSTDKSTFLLDSIENKYLLKEGVRLIAFIARARTPMPKSTENYFSESERYMRLSL